MGIYSVSCNSGVLELKVFHLYSAKKRRTLVVGDVVLGVVFSVRPNKVLKKGDLCKALVVMTAKSISSFSGIFVVGSNTRLILLKKDTEEPLGTKIKGSVSSLLFFTKFRSVLLLSTGVV